MNHSLNNILEAFNHMINDAIEDSTLNTNLEKSMRYSLEAGGKRIRPLLLLSTLKMLQPESIEKGMKTALALEMIHTYSLIHDDLPAMDDDNLRRGKPTNHKVFGEWLAILSGDALLTKAFEIIASDDTNSAEVKIKLVQLLGQASGHLGMVGGQTLDMQSENQPISLPTLEKIHSHKTGALIRFAVEAATIIAQIPQELSQTLIRFAEHLGVIFQIKDDLLDVYGEATEIGKPVGSDITNHKGTYVTLLGQQNAEKELSQHVNKAESILKDLSTSYHTNDLKVLLDLFHQRHH
ncbi:polyprenyl synthetase family protein [Staphylococcus felis]|uniref:Farnesyl diphosphate synthase n=1 Tax=Staphylococcus felis TaxID=46127 RepID=A0A3E0IIM3_9STAP|nr:farnesyl diphosphate synthase [Staphylococcus felis]MBH9581129.1 polyprenyl synthetase family protein [Staphylococcus felis]MDM8327714.1 polyprenyl synthetase family protein [Staphylococcus felis]MDQ7193379.1 polyprenyl synthetase family protein [Staphylococcus felis]REH74646.1 polyprenyl synthetase family protein [Staphylococcus felis]REH79805.1 polyprenyl synthetase family protein [Staphylococcus felis]